METQLQKNILRLTTDLIKIPSMTGNTKGIQSALNLIRSETTNSGVTEEFESYQTRSTLIHNAKTTNRKFKIILNGHVDVVAGESGLFEPIIRDGKLRGRGAYDMKAATAVMTMAYKDVVHEVSYPLALQITTDEESGGYHGTKYQIEKGIRADFVIAGESNTDLHIKNQAKGFIALKLITRGESVHGAYPWKVNNPILQMQRVLNMLYERFPSPSDEVWKTTVTPTTLNTNDKTFNVIPNECSCIIDIRFVPEDKDHIMDDVLSTLPEGVEIEVLHNEPAFFTSPQNPYLKGLQAATRGVIGRSPEIKYAHGTSDSRHFSRVNTAAVEFGLIGGFNHGDNEWADVRSMVDYYHILKRFLLSIQ